MNRPRPLLRSLLAATCGTTLLTAAVLGTGPAAFAEETPEPVTATAEPATDATTDSAPVTPSEESTSPEATNPVDAASAPETAPVEEQVTDTPVADASSEADAPVPADTSTEPSPPAAPSAEAKVAPLVEVVVPEEAAPQVVVTVPRSVGLGTELREITFTADPETEPVVRLALSQATADMLGFYEFQMFEDGDWVDIPFVESRAGLTYEFPVVGGEVKLLVGVSQAAYEDAWAQFLEDEGLSITALDEEIPEPLDFIEFTTELVDAPGDPELQEHSIAVVAPEIIVTEAAPEEVEAGDSFIFAYSVTNRTGTDYPESASLELFQSGLLWVDDEPYIIAPADLTLTCSVDGGPAVEIDIEELDHPFVGPGGSLALGALPAGGSVDVECQVDLAADLPDSDLDLLPMLTIGDSRAPLTFDENAAQVITIWERSEPGPAPEPEPTKPAPAQPAPVPTPITPTNPPAAAPVRQVPTTELPRTGTDTLPLAAAGLGLVLAGAGALLSGRRRARTTDQIGG